MLGLQIGRFVLWSVDPCGPRDIEWWIGPTLALTPPYLWILVRLDRRADPKEIGRALSVAMWWGAINFVVAVAIIVANPGSTWWSEVVTDLDVLGWVAYAGLQTFLVTSAVRAVATIPGAESTWFLLFGSTVRVVLYLLVLLLIAMVPPSIIERQPGAEAIAVGDLRSINSSQAAFQGAYPDRGYASTFEELHEFTHPAALAAAQPWYRIEMTAGPRDALGKVNLYQAWATRLRPLELCRSFFTDESGIIHATKEDRPATAADEVIQ